MSVRDLRLKTGLSQSAFSKRLDIPLRTLQQWEQGRSNPPAYVESLIEYAMVSLGDAEGVVLPEPVIIERSAYAIAPRTSWKVCIDEPFTNCERIYPLQQRKVRALLDELEGDLCVKSVTVFGSSVTDRCHIGSDVDLFAELTCDKTALSRSYDFEYDFWSNYTADERLRREIERNGVVVYARSANAVR